MLQWLFQADKRVFHFSKRVEVRTSYSPRKNFSATYHNSRYSSQESREHRQKRLISPSQYSGKVLGRITYSFRLAWAQRTPCTAAETKSSRASGVAAVSFKEAVRAVLAKRIGAWLHWTCGHWLDIMRKCIGIDGESSLTSEGLKKAEWLVELFLRS